MNAFVIRDAESTFTRISKRRARALWGKTDIVLCPVKLRPGFPWAPHILYTSGQWDEFGPNFDDFVGQFEYYNCISNETGSYAAFYTVT